MLTSVPITEAASTGAIPAWIAFINQNAGFFNFLATLAVALFGVGSLLLWDRERRSHRRSRKQIALSLRQIQGRITSRIAWLDNERDRDEAFRNVGVEAVQQTAREIAMWVYELKQVAREMGPEPVTAAAYLDHAIFAGEDSAQPAKNLTRLAQAPESSKVVADRSEAADQFRAYLKRMAGALDAAYDAFPWRTRILKRRLFAPDDTYIDVVQSVESDLDNRFPSPGPSIEGDTLE